MMTCIRLLEKRFVKQIFFYLFTCEFIDIMYLFICEIFGKIRSEMKYIYEERKFKGI